MMLLPLFEATPAGWEAVTTLNEGKRDPEISLAAHFSSWAATAPAAQQSFITAIAAVFGVKPA
jgi:ribulose 1,5-bisphosphate carboxylase large subunit-like protein